jgi:glycosyltransferase involved in cell wall biosynthesis
MRIAVAICTCRRPEGLARLLDALQGIDADDALSVVVVENDESRQGAELCRQVAAGYRWPLHCVIEPAFGISYARNRAVTESLRHAPDFIAMLDDDEWPEKQWLRELLRIQRATDADAVGGPVVPHFAHPGTYWANFRSYYGLDQRLPDGARCTLYGAGNVLVRRICFEDAMPEPFNPAFALSGGEDLVFFQRLAIRGFRMHWSTKALVHEYVPPERMTMRWLKDRQRRRGCLNIASQRLLEPGPYREAIRLLKTLGSFVSAGATAVAAAIAPEFRGRAPLLLDYAHGRLLGHRGRLLEPYRQA